MSHATVAIAPATQVLLNTLMPAVAVGAAGFAVTAGAIMAARKLRCDFEQAKVEFEERCRQDEAAFRRQQNQQAVLSMAGSAFGALIESGTENTTLTFLQRSLDDLTVRAQAAGHQETVQRVADLAASLSPEAVEQTLQAFFGLSDQLDAAILSTAQQSGDYTLVFQALRAEIDSPILADAKHEKLRAQFEQQLAKLEAVGGQSTAIVRQGADNLKARIRREISEEAERHARENEERAKRRGMVAEAYAMIRAVMQASDDPDERTRASALLTLLGAAFQGGAPPAVSELEALLSKARSLFNKCEKRMEDAAAQAFVADSVRDVLLSMGYQVSEVPSEVANGDPGCMVSIDRDSGVVVSLAPDGRMVTEMVAFTSLGQDPDEEAEKKVCAVVDDILAGLRSRDISMVDKSRKKLRPGHRLRRVDKRRTEELSTVASAKARTVE